MRKDIDMLHGPLGPAIIRFTIPVILTTLLQTLFHTVDLIVVGQFCGSLKVAAVTATGSLTSLLISLFLNNLTTIMALFGGSVDLSWISGLMGGWSGGGSEISIIPVWLVVLALLFATVVGLLSGIAPAGRAVKISALEAIRHE